jgi:hypothetical protein
MGHGKPSPEDASGSLMKCSRQLSLPGITLAALLSLTLSCVLVACQNVATYTQPAVVRVIDASYMAPAVNVNLDGALFAANIGQSTFTNYGTLTAHTGALISIAPAAGGAPLISSNYSLLPGQQHSILISDNGLTPATYSLTLLDDQRTAAAQGHSAFRFINQAIKTAPVDIYMVPTGVNLKDAVPLATNLSAGSVTGYLSFSSQPVNLIVTLTGSATPICTSAVIELTGSEVRTALLLNAQLTTNPPVTVFIGNDVN